jgi:CRISPR-associated protein (TIGR02710 family)
MSTPAPNQPAPITAALLSVGGSPAPVLHVLRQHRPANVWYFCSPTSRGIADDIQAQLEWRPQARFIEAQRFEELGPCYRTLRRKLPEILTETHVPPAEVLVDYTGGTKTMSAALVLAATELFQQFSYVGAEQRAKAGLGITLDGKERVLYQANPWSDLAVREVERARDLWSSCQFESAARILRAIAPRLPHRLRFGAIADLADAMGARHRLDFPAAARHLNPLQRKLPSLLDGRPDFGLLGFARTARDLCTACEQAVPGDTLLRELLDNTLRTAAQERFEDAAARLYRAMEMQGQLWLTATTQGAFRNGRLRPASTLPAPLAELAFCQPDAAGEVKLSLEQVFRALGQLGHPQAATVVTDIARGNQSRWRAATEKRNSSILAHGVSPIGADGFQQMKTIAVEFLGFDLTAEANPIPPLDPRWLE